MCYQDIEPIFFVREVDTARQYGKHAGPKARRDIESFLIPHCSDVIDVDFSWDKPPSSFFGRLKRHLRIARQWSKTLKNYKNSVLLFNFPLTHYSFFDTMWFKRVMKRRNKTCLFVHDLSSLRYAKENYDIIYLCYSRMKESAFLCTSSSVILHNEKMRAMAHMYYGLEPSKVKNINLFDYKISCGERKSRVSIDLPVVIAGNLSFKKAGYIQHLPSSVDWNLYGNGLDEDFFAPNVHVKGSFEPDLLPRMLEGSFGLVWDGPEANTCNGDYGSYLRINNPHKVSLYLAAGLPVLIWSQAALADYVVANGVGIVVDNLFEIPHLISCIDKKEYESMRKRVCLLSEKVTEGEHTISVFKSACEYMKNL